MRSESGLHEPYSFASSHLIGPHRLATDPLCTPQTPYNNGFEAWGIGHRPSDNRSLRPPIAAMPEKIPVAQSPSAPVLLVAAVTLSLIIVTVVSRGEEAPPKDLAPKKARGNKLTLRDWDIPQEGMFDDHGKVSIDNNELHLAEGSPATGIRFKRGVPKIEYEIHCEAKRTGGSDFFYGLTFPVRQDYCSWIVGGWGGTAVGLSNVDGLSAIENSTTQYMEFENDRWYKIRLRVAEGKILGWIDKKQMFEVPIKDHTFDIWWEQTPLRPLGIASWNTSAALRNFQLIKLKPLVQ